MIAAPRCAGSFFFAGGMPWKARAHAESPAPAAGFFYAGSVRCGVFLRASCHAAALRRRIFPPQRDFVERAGAFCFAGAIWGSGSVFTASLACFCGVCKRTLLRWRVFGQRASAFCFDGAIWGSGSVSTASLARFRQRASARGKSGTSCRICLCRQCAVRGVLSGFMPCR